MTTERDKLFIAKLWEDVQAAGPIETVEQYRVALPLILEARKNRDPLPQVADYLPEVTINENCNAAIAVPFRTSEDPLPVLLHCHGHGGLAGSAHSYRRHTHDMAAGGYLTITPDYRKAPEHKHPAGLDDLLATALWIKENAASYGGDGSEIIVSGDSVGATFAAVTVLRLLTTESAPRVKAFVGLEGFYEREKQGFMDFIIDAYMPEGYKLEDLKHPWISPTEGFKAGELYPPILLITGSGDFAAPSTMRFALSLFEKQIAFQLHVLEDMPHDFAKMIDLDGYAEAHRLLFAWLKACR